MTLEVIKAHSPIGASSMDRWSKCPGSVKLSEGVPDIQSEYAKEGTRAHEAAEHYLKNGYWPDNTPEDMIEHLFVYVAAIQDALLDAKFEDTEVFIEQRFDLSRLHPDLFGTADCVIYFAERKLVQVYDLKYGQGYAVEVKDNSQLKYYALGALTTVRGPVTEVESIIVQPRCNHPDGPIRKHKYHAYELIDFIDDLIRFAKATEMPGAPLNAGDHCKFCKAAPQCPELRKRVEMVAKEEFKPAWSYDPLKLSNTLSWLPSLENFVKSVREFAYQEACHGRIPPGWKLVPKRATRKWRDEVNARSVLSLVLPDEDLLSKPELKSPAQVEKVLGKQNKKILEPLVVQESSGQNLVPESDSRQAITNGSEFEVIEIANKQQ